MNVRKFALLCISTVTAATLMTACETGGNSTGTTSSGYPTARSHGFSGESAPSQLLTDSDMNRLFHAATFHHKIIKKRPN